ncbi:hypothetical protein QCA50_020002 [Cerrena zonata]|uniref:Uncharacterized protein n=1 Tax=Cerrena zonata TaxID=2478898 RepID=A0AAW0FIL2_9APHY
MGDNRSKSAKKKAKLTKRNEDLNPNSAGSSDQTNVQQILSDTQTDLELEAGVTGVASIATPKRAHKLSIKLPLAKKAKTVSETEGKIVFIVPCIDGANQRHTAKLDTPFVEVLASIREIIGCTGYRLQPDLTYKLGNASSKSVPAMSFATDDDWQGRIEDVTKTEKKKKDSVPVTILVPVNYMHSLKNKKSKSSSNTIASNRVKEKPKLIDLDKSEDDGDEDGVTVMDQEMKIAAQLTTQLSKCQRCGPIPCRISHSGDHVQVTFGQIKA